MTTIDLRIAEAYLADETIQFRNKVGGGKWYTVTPYEEPSDLCRLASPLLEFRVVKERVGFFKDPEWSFAPLQ